VLSPWSIEQGKRQKEGAKDFTVHPDVRRTPEKGLRAVSWPRAVPISADNIYTHFLIWSTVEVIDEVYIAGERVD
jgi:hypothetical protein